MERKATKAQQVYHMMETSVLLQMGADYLYMAWHLAETRFGFAVHTTADAIDNIDMARTYSHEHSVGNRMAWDWIDTHYIESIIKRIQRGGGKPECGELEELKSAVDRLYVTVNKVNDEIRADAREIAGVKHDYEEE